MPPAKTQSPPKRMTRSRAKAVEEKQQTQVIATPGAKAAVPKTTKRKTRADDPPVATEQEGADEVASIPKVKQPAYTQPTRATRGKAKTVEPAKATTNDTAATNAPQTRKRGRPPTVKKDEAAASKVGAQSTGSRTTRGKAAAQQPPPVTTAGVKKKVTFQENIEADKENVIEVRPTSKDGKEVVVQKSTAATSQAPHKGRPAATKAAKNPAASEEYKNKPRAEPLSPKKATQVAKGQGTAEASSTTAAPEQPPMKLLSQSPQKNVATPHKSPAKGGSSGDRTPPSPADELAPSC